MYSEFRGDLRKNLRDFLSFWPQRSCHAYRNWDLRVWQLEPVSCLCFFKSQMSWFFDNNNKKILIKNDDAQRNTWKTEGKDNYKEIRISKGSTETNLYRSHLLLSRKTRQEIYLFLFLLCFGLAKRDVSHPTKKKRKIRERPCNRS